MAKRKLKPYFNAEGKLPITKWKKELEKLDEEIVTDPGKAEYQEIKAELDLLSKIQYYAKTAIQDHDLRPEQKMQKQLDAMKRRQDHSR